VKVSSPIGELPFELRKMSVRSDGIKIEGMMGAWPARVQIEPRDLPALVRLLAKPAAVTVIIAGLASLAARRRNRR
jgi:hypothetical protein